MASGEKLVAKLHQWHLNGKKLVASCWVGSVWNVPLSLGDFQVSDVDVLTTVVA